MTLQGCIDYCTVLQDKYGSPNVINDEWVNYLNHGTNEWLNRIIPDEEPTDTGYENSKDVISNIQPLIYPLTVTTTASGAVLDSDITIALTAAIAANGGVAETTPVYLRILSVGLPNTDGNTYPVKYVRQNNLYDYQTNYFKKPTATSPRYTLVSNGFKIYPSTPGVQVPVTVLKKPRTISLTNLNDQMELDSYTLFKVITIALQLAGVATRDQEVLEAVAAAKIEGKR